MNIQLSTGNLNQERERWGGGVGVGGCWGRRGPVKVLGEEMLFNQT